MTLEERLFAQHSGRSLLLDSNLLLVFVTGAADPQLFGRFKRVSSYTLKDYDLLVRFLGAFRILLTTPHILTEVSNLGNSLPEYSKADWFEHFATLLHSEGRTPGLRERWMPANELATVPEFVEFGITDAALARLSSEALVVTEDHRLSGTLRARGLSVLNFNDIRALEQLF
ncbi:MAG: hypothetical protein ABSG62_05405 [Terracidiphilus sp.]|jgi:hypothetical protein